MQTQIMYFFPFPPPEDRINLSMIRGEFENLQGKGKPLERDRTPGLDRTTDLFMDVLVGVRGHCMGV